MYLVSVFATLSADYRVSVTVNNNTLEGSPFPLTIYPQQRQVSHEHMYVALSIYPLQRRVSHVYMYVTLSVDYQLSVTVNNNTLTGSPFTLTIYPQQRQVSHEHVYVTLSVYPQQRRVSHVQLYVTLSVDCRVSVTVNNKTLTGSPFSLTIYPKQRKVAHKSNCTHV